MLLPAAVAGLVADGERGYRFESWYPHRTEKTQSVSSPPNPINLTTHEHTRTNTTNTSTPTARRPSSSASISCPSRARDGVLFPATFAAGAELSAVATTSTPPEREERLPRSTASARRRTASSRSFKEDKYKALVPQITVKAGEKPVSILEAGHRAGDAIVRCSDVADKICRTLSRRCFTATPNRWRNSRRPRSSLASGIRATRRPSCRASSPRPSARSTCASSRAPRNTSPPRTTSTT